MLDALGAWAWVERADPAELRPVLGGIRTERDLLESILFPSASFVRSYESVVVTTKVVGVVTLKAVEAAPSSVPEVATSV